MVSTEGTAAQPANATATITTTAGASQLRAGAEKIEGVCIRPIFAVYIVVPGSVTNTALSH